MIYDRLVIAIQLLEPSIRHPKEVRKVEAPTNQLHQAREAVQCARIHRILPVVVAQHDQIPQEVVAQEDQIQEVTTNFTA